MTKQIEYRLKTGQIIPKLGLGTWRLAGKEGEQTIKTALELGYKLFDTAEIYDNQRTIGKTIEKTDRKNIFITSKVWRNHLYYHDILTTCKRTLKELQTDYIDLFLIHWPNKQISMKETFQAIKELKDTEEIRAVGVSNFTINHLKEALLINEALVQVNQVEFHPYLYQKKLLKFCKKNNIIIIAYSPLGKGFIIKNTVIKKIAEKYKKTPAQVCLKWNLQKGNVVIPKASAKKHLEENMKVFNWELSPKDIKRIDALNRNKRYVNPPFNEFNF